MGTDVDYVLNGRLQGTLRGLNLLPVGAKLLQGDPLEAPQPGHPGGQVLQVLFDNLAAYHAPFTLLNSPLCVLS